MNPLRFSLPHSTPSISPVKVKIQRGKKESMGNTKPAAKDFLSLWKNDLGRMRSKSSRFHLSSVVLSKEKKPLNGIAWFAPLSIIHLFLRCITGKRRKVSRHSVEEKSDKGFRVEKCLA